MVSIRQRAERQRGHWPSGTSQRTAVAQGRGVISPTEPATSVIAGQSLDRRPCGTRRQADSSVVDFELMGVAPGIGTALDGRVRCARSEFKSWCTEKNAAAGIERSMLAGGGLVNARRASARRTQCRLGGPDIYGAVQVLAELVVQAWPRSSRARRRGGSLAALG